MKHIRLYVNESGQYPEIIAQIGLESFGFFDVRSSIYDGSVSILRFSMRELTITEFREAAKLIGNTPIYEWQDLFNLLYRKGYTFGEYCKVGETSELILLSDLYSLSNPYCYYYRFYKGDRYIAAIAALSEKQAIKKALKKYQFKQFEYDRIESAWVDGTPILNGIKAFSRYQPFIIAKYP